MLPSYLDGSPSFSRPCLWTSLYQSVQSDQSARSGQSGQSGQSSSLVSKTPLSRGWMSAYYNITVSQAVFSFQILAQEMRPLFLEFEFKSPPPRSNA